MFNRSTSPGRKFSYALAAVAMVLQISTIMLYGQGQSVSQTRDGETGLLTMVICSPSGLKQITIDTSGNIVDEQTPADNHIECPFSLALSANNLLSPSCASMVAPAISRYVTQHYSFSTKRLAAMSFLAVRGRGPPWPSSPRG